MNSAPLPVAKTKKGEVSSLFNFNMTAVVQIVNFFVLLFILKKFAYKPLLNLMEERRNRIVSDLENAEKNRQESERLRQDYEEQLAKVKTEAAAILDRANKIAAETKEEILTEARAEQERLLTAAREQIAREQQKALADVRNEVANLSVLVATRIVGNSMDSDKDRAIIQDVISQLDSKQGDLSC